MTSRWQMRPTISVRIPLLLFSCGLALVLISVLSATKTYKGHDEIRAIRPLVDYSYVGDDFPSYYPIELDPVSFTPENTIHYQIYSMDAKDEWASVFPEGGGFLYLGPQMRPFGLALFHQMHCLMRIREAMSSRKDSEHVRHCFNYIRQSILCESNPTIEPVIPILGRRSVNAEIPRTCKDWTMLYRLAEDNFHSVTGNVTKRAEYE